ncbi:MAG: MBL fold metallo-hydrolase [Endozoicomonadaceae bacterium]|nr:MBL fold metallo-hydrolase [Endozoicomonadaceae bacterium]
MNDHYQVIDNRWLVDVFSVGPLQCNCTIIGDLTSKQCLVFDPGGQAVDIFNRTKKHHLDISALICTHAHFDHILAAGDLHQLTGALIYLNRHDFSLWKSLELQCNFFNIPYQPIPNPQHWIVDEQVLPCCSGIALHTPGHTPGSMSFWFESACLLIAGDTLFRHSVGRTDLWGGNQEQLQRSIREKLYTLDEKALVITGHGLLTTISEEKRMNRIVPAIPC